MEAVSGAAAAAHMPPPVLATALVSSAILRGDSAEQKEFQAKDELQTGKRRERLRSKLSSAGVAAAGRRKWRAPAAAQLNLKLAGMAGVEFAKGLAALRCKLHRLAKGGTRNIRGEL